MQYVKLKKLNLILNKTLIKIYIMKKTKLLFLIIGIFAITIAMVPIQELNVQHDQTEQIVAPVFHKAGIFDDSDGMITGIITFIMTVFAGAFAFIKKKLSKVLKLIKELYEAINEVDEALKDDKLTKDELKKIKEQLQDVVSAFKDLIKKDKKES